MACRWSAPRPAPFPTRCRPMPACWSSRTTCKALTRTLRMLIENPQGAAVARGGRARSRRSAADLGGLRQALRRRDRGAGMSFQRRLARAARALRSPRAQRRRDRRGRRRRSPARPSVTIVDLACGTGSTLRALAPRIKARQNWRLVDNDLSLLARAPQSRRRTSTSRPCRSISTAILKPRSTARSIWSRRRRCSISSPTNGCERLAVETAARRLPVYAALSYDGRVEIDAGRCRRRRRSSPRSTRISAPTRALVRRSGRTRRSKAIERFERVGYSVVQGPSDWVFAPTDREIQIEMLSGWAAAAREIGDMPLPDVVGWLTRRRDLVAAGRSSIRVGHVDFFARPTGTR